MHIQRWLVCYGGSHLLLSCYLEAETAQFICLALDMPKHVREYRQ